MTISIIGADGLTLIDRKALNEQSPVDLANALSIAVYRVYGEIDEWYVANRLCRSMDILQRQGVEKKP